jgi:type IV pilus assembly protein PilB
MRLERSTNRPVPDQVAALPPPPPLPDEPLSEEHLLDEPQPGPGLAYDPESLPSLVAAVIGATGLLTADELAAVRLRAGNDGSIAQAIVEERLASSEELARIAADRYHLPLLDLAAAGVSLEASALVPLHVLERVCAIPYALEGNELLVAIADPGDVQGTDELRLATAYQIRLGVASRDDIEAELRRLVRAAESYGARAILNDIGGLEAVALDDDDADLDAEDGISDAPLVRLVNAIIFQAAEDGASDIHFEPQESELIVRLRIDGVLHEVQRIPKRMAGGVTARLKVLAKLDIAQRRTPQDGRISLNAAAAGRRLDVRLATLPTVDGEGVVMRLLDKSKRAPTLEELGLSEEMRARMSEIVGRPTGAVLVTGPTGSGKSTTLYAALNSINNPAIKVITVEDPVEFRLAGVNQVQINNRAGMTFAAALRAILRSDPDVVMVGEIRDSETAKTSIEAALTGHLVLSTLHTNDAPSVLTRLNEMGVPPFLTGSAVSAVLAQRLARKLCTHCSERYVPTPEDLVRARMGPDDVAASDGIGLFRKRGCARCGQTGYKGRIGIFQLLLMTETLQQLASAQASREEIERAAIGEGMGTLWDDGLAKVMAGLTSLEELARITV